MAEELLPSMKIGKLMDLKEIFSLLDLVKSSIKNKFCFIPQSVLTHKLRCAGPLIVLLSNRHRRDRRAGKKRLAKSGAVHENSRPRRKTWQVIEKMTLATVPFEISDPINARILAISEDRIQGFQRDPLSEISHESGVALPVVIERIQSMLRAGTIRRVRQPCWRPTSRKARWWRGKCRRRSWIRRSITCFNRTLFRPRRDALD
jgi:hypothetical protein